VVNLPVVIGKKCLVRGHHLCSASPSRTGLAFFGAYLAGFAEGLVNERHEVVERAARFGGYSAGYGPEVVGEVAGEDGGAMELPASRAVSFSHPAAYSGRCVSDGGE